MRRGKKGQLLVQTNFDNCPIQKKKKSNYLVITKDKRYLEIRLGAGGYEHFELGIRVLGAKVYGYLKLRVTGIWR